MFITMEGVEGSGKSTQIQRLAARLREVGLPLVVSKEPGGTALGAELRRLLLAHHASGEVWCPEAELLLFYADRAQHLATLVKPALDSGSVVLVDRFEDSSWAYQGARGVSAEDLTRLREVVLKDFRPDLTLILDMNPEVSLNRVEARNQELGSAFLETRFDQEALDYHRRVRAIFLGIAAREPRRVVVVPAEGSADAVGQAIWDVVAPFLLRHGFAGA